MNNKIVFYLILCVFFPVMASEKTEESQKNSILQQCILGVQAQVSINQNRFEWYDIIDLNNDNSIMNPNPQVIGESTVVSVRDLSDVGLYMVMRGNDSSNSFKVLFEDKDCNVYLKNRLQNFCDKKIDPCIHLMQNEENNLKRISLQLTKEQAKQYLDGKSSWMSQFIVSFSIVGLIALVYYFTLHSKCMTLLGRG